VTRPTIRACAAVTASLSVVLLSAGPALASDPLGPREGENPGQGLGAGATLLLFLGVPALILLGTAALVWLPGLVKANRYRPSRGWTASPVWFAGPPDPVAAVQEADAGSITRGGASGSW
jgi:hypothetical protein